MSDSLQPRGLQHARLPCPSLSRNLPKLMSIELVVPSSYLILCCSLLLLPLIIPSIRVFSSEAALLIRWPKCWSLSVRISLSNGYSGLISFRIGWFDLLAIKGTSPAPQFESVSSLALSLPYCPALTSVRDCGRNHSLDYTDLCQQSGVSAF